LIPYSIYLRVLKKRWWVLLVVLALCVGAAAIHTWRQEPVYKASTKVVVIPNEEVRDAGDVIRSLDTLDRRSVVATMADLPETREMRAAAQEMLGLSDSERRSLRVRTAVLPNTNIIRIDVHGPDPAAAARFANAVASVTRDRAARLYRIYEMQTLEAATERRSPVHPNPRRNYTVAAILGVLLGLAAAFALEAVLGPHPGRD
jgi:capsular polysaccharide biosynthesis protein